MPGFLVDFDNLGDTAMILRGIDFGHVFCAAGARNFIGEGYWHSRFTDWTGSTLVTKTTTIDPRAGNMPLKSGSTQPRDFLPDCIRVKPLLGIALNAVGLSGPGARALFEDGRWQGLAKPFLISFMPVAPTKEGRLDETRRFVDLVQVYRSGFTSRFGIEFNGTCPNLKNVDFMEVVSEAQEELGILAALGVPVSIKLNLLVTPATAAEIAAHCDALCITNAIPFGKLAGKIDWVRYFGTDDPAQSPLAKYGGGALSGPPLLPLVHNWVYEFRNLESNSFPINAGGGVFSIRDAMLLLGAGATSVFLGTVGMLRPWRVQGIIQAVNHFCEARDRREQST